MLELAVHHVEKDTKLRSPDNLLVREKEGKFLILNPNVPAWLITNEVGIAILRLCDGTRTCSQIAQEANLSCSAVSLKAIDEFLHKAYEKKIFEHKRPAYKLPHFPLRSVYLNITEVCNLQCTYCYANQRECSTDLLSLKDYQKLLYSIRAISQNVNIHITGGEPLTSPILFELVKLVKEHKFTTYLLTNGTLITTENVKLVVDSFDTIKISLDGSEAAIHDATRGFGTFDRVMIALNLLEIEKKPYQLSMTVTKKNIKNVAQMSARFGNKLTFAPYFPQRANSSLNSELAITGAEYFHALSEVIEINPYCDIDAIISENKRNQIRQKCSIADGSISIASNGDVYPCQLLHFNQFKAGNIQESAFEEIYLKSPTLLALREQTVENVKGCDTCGVSLLCGGGCVARHYYETGSLQTAGAFCEYEQLAIPDALLDRHSLVPILGS